MDATRVLLLLTSYVTASAVRCKVCEGVSDPQYCFKTVECAMNEECFVEKVIGDDDNIYFNSGCLSREVCRLLSLTRRSELQVCHECCGSDHCNVHLCTAPATNDTKCYQCDDVERPQDCHTLVTCKPQEICYTGEFINANYEKRHRMGCETRKRCTLLESLGRRRALGGQTCNECCPKNGCNRHLCFDAVQGPSGKSTVPPTSSISSPMNLNPTPSVYSPSKTTVVASTFQTETTSAVPTQGSTTQRVQTAPPSTQTLATQPSTTQRVQTAPPSTQTLATQPSTSQRVQTAPPSTQTLATQLPSQPTTQTSSQPTTQPPSKLPTHPSTQTTTQPPTQTATQLPTRTSAQISTTTATQKSTSPTPRATFMSTPQAPISSVRMSTTQRQSTLPPSPQPSSTLTQLVTSASIAVAMTTMNASLSPGVSTCRDFNTDCENLNKSLGVCNPVTEATTRFCAKFCGICSDTTSVAPSVSMATVPVSTGPPCVDGSDDCAILNATLGVCDPVTEVTTRYCRKFCGVCA